MKKRRRHQFIRRALLLRQRGPLQHVLGHSHLFTEIILRTATLENIGEK
ncbi:MAG: hypothetical protein V3R26_01300 [Hyphomicrobium sp.]